MSWSIRRDQRAQRSTSWYKLVGHCESFLPRMKKSPWWGEVFGMSKHVTAFKIQFFLSGCTRLCVDIWCPTSQQGVPLYVFLKYKVFSARKSRIPYTLYNCKSIGIILLDLFAVKKMQLVWLYNRWLHMNMFSGVKTRISLRAGRKPTYQFFLILSTFTWNM